MNSHVFYPMYINLSGVNVLIIGGGTVGTKRALNFLKHGAKVTVLSLNFTDELLKHENEITLIRKDARSINENFLSNYYIVITATNDSTLNHDLCNLTKKLGKLCNNPTNPDDSNFIVPIFYTDDKVSIAITTFGKSSLSSKFILDLIKTNVLTEDIYLLIDTMEKVKEYLKGSIPEPSRRFSLYSKIFNDKLFRDYVKEGKQNLALERAKAIING